MARDDGGGSAVLIVGGGLLLWWWLSPSPAAAVPETGQPAGSPLTNILKSLGITVGTKAATGLISVAGKAAGSGAQSLADLLTGSPAQSAAVQPLTSAALQEVSSAVAPSTAPVVSAELAPVAAGSPGYGAGEEALSGIVQAAPAPAAPSPITTAALQEVATSLVPSAAPVVPAELAPLAAGAPGYGIGEEALSGIVQAATAAPVAEVAAAVPGTIAAEVAAGVLPETAATFGESAATAAFATGATGAETGAGALTATFGTVALAAAPFAIFGAAFMLAQLLENPGDTPAQTADRVFNDVERRFGQPPGSLPRWFDANAAWIKSDLTNWGRWDDMRQQSGRYAYMQGLMGKSPQELRSLFSTDVTQAARVQKYAASGWDWTQSADSLLVARGVPASWIFNGPSQPRDMGAGGYSDTSR